MIHFQEERILHLISFGDATKLYQFNVAFVLPFWVTM